MRFSLGSLNDCGGKKPGGSGMSNDVQTPAEMRTGFPTEPPVPQQVDVMSREKLHCWRLVDPGP